METPAKKQPHRFQPGNKFGGGRPPKDRYLSMLRSAVTEKDWNAIVAKVIDKAREGDRHSIEWLGKYLLPQVRIVEATVDYAQTSREEIDRKLLELTPDKIQTLTAAATIVSGEIRE